MKNKRLIILEGPDRCGKSTIANHIENLYGYRKNHFSKPFDANLLYDFLKVKLDTNIVFDRSWLSRIYYTVMRDGFYPYKAIEQIQQIEQIFIENGYDIYYYLVYRPWEWVVQYHIEELANGDSLPLLQRHKEHLGWIPFSYVIENYLNSKIGVIHGFEDISKKRSHSICEIFNAKRSVHTMQLLRSTRFWQKQCKGNQ